MSWILTIIAIWLCLAVAAAVVVGHVIRNAETRGSSGQHDPADHGPVGAPIGPEQGTRPRIPLPTPSASGVAATARADGQAPAESSPSDSARAAIRASARSKASEVASPTS